ncbi:glutamate-1-semialdehyde 2,1-aminomutase [Desulfobaculum xiamenense]|uniref:Glutamate-1-semialdehyde 2,1-aminomutase n=1 Tax=Desulfobaculum xiamenense TaxID=995050 RepID=A0A846QPI0_9BACT|nr:glutamate-1-semialdehyde 2,1-aminomutase [Desulfobaculum xiamenense]NJB68223.1 glutamate-1-semialdehyde 2,1-aminomutase [Desulfobaculum xiamenense]
MSKSQELFEQAKTLIPGGVNSPVRACLSVGVDPIFIDSARGSRLTTVDGDELVDFVMSWGPMLLGYGHPEVNAAAAAAAAKGTSFGAPCALEVEMAKAVVDAVPSIEMVRMVSSGTEATMSALRLARGYTGRSKVVKFMGNYHGHSDSFLASAGSGLATLSIPGTPGVPAETVAHTLLAPYNDLDAVKALFAAHGSDIAAVIVEPCAGNMGLVLPADGFLKGLRAVTEQYGALLIFDEVITGFRVSFGGAQKRFGITPDLTTLGKIIGGGYPVGCYGGKREIMERVAPSGDVYQAGTLSGNPVAMAAGLATLRLLEQADYGALERRTVKLVDEMTGLFMEKSVPVTVNTIASLFTVFFTREEITDFDSARKADGERYASFYRQMRANGVNLAPSGYECSFTSFAHTEEDYDHFLDAVSKVQF